MDIDSVSLPTIQTTLFNLTRPNPQDHVSTRTPSSYKYKHTCQSCAQVVMHPQCSPHSLTNRSGSPAVASSNSTGLLVSAAFESLMLARMGGWEGRRMFRMWMGCGGTLS